MLEPLSTDQYQLVLGECRVDLGECNAMERKVPCREPRVLPFVGHRHDVERVEGAPTAVAARQALVGRFGLGRIAIEPPADVVAEQLFGPQHPGERLAHHQRFVGRCVRWGEFRIELVSFFVPFGRDSLEIVAERVGDGSCRTTTRPQSQPEFGCCAGLDDRLVPARDFGADQVRVDGGRSIDDVVVDPVLRVRRAVRVAVQAGDVRLVLAEERGRWITGRADTGEQ